MLDEATKAKLRDPAYLDLHLMAVAAIRKVGDVDWYDSHFARRYQVARHYLAQVRPDTLESFERGFDVLRPPDGFEPQLIVDLFDTPTRERIVETTRAIPAAMLKDDEIADFGCYIVHDQPWFVELQRDLLPRVSALTGCALETGYNFLSLYGGSGRCDPHMDEPRSMFTLDYCIEQSEEWPIWFSKVTGWPTIDTMRAWSPAAIRGDAALEFRPFVLKPGEALLFNGSSQWHYRDAITPGGFRNLLFFHYYPEGCRNLVWPPLWPSHFDIPELGPLCELFHEGGTDGLIG